MLLGALFDLGVPRRAVRDALAALGIEGLRMRVSRVSRGGLSALYVRFSGPERSPRERRWPQIRRSLARAALAPRVRERSLAIFERLAVAEAKVHGVALERVHLHEVGAVDALGDIVGVCAALEHLDSPRVSASSLALGSGRVETQHGPLPLPAPATLELLRGLPTHPLEVNWESVTPTGAALVSVLADDFGAMPALRPSRVGYGAGDDRRGPLPNSLRAVLGVGDPGLESDRVCVLETNLDDMSPEHLPYLLERLMEEGALDAALSPLQMKKGRPGHLLRVLALPADRDRLAGRILAESTALGVRFQEASRWLLRREVRRVQTPYGPIRVKLAWSPDGRPSAAAEYESCARAARRFGVSIQEVSRSAERRAEEEWI